jgi:hypothetical protein
LSLPAVTSRSSIESKDGSLPRLLPGSVFMVSRSGNCAQ